VRPLPALLSSRWPTVGCHAAPFAITFDDGYADNLEQARPRGWPAMDCRPTVVRTAGAIGATREFWWDELEQTLLGERALPAILSLQVASVARRWELGADAARMTVPTRGHPSMGPWEEAHRVRRHAL
jgi:hypothetical protein